MFVRMSMHERARMCVCVCVCSENLVFLRTLCIQQQKHRLSNNTWAAHLPN